MFSKEKAVERLKKRIGKGRTYSIVRYTLVWSFAMIIFVPLFNTIFHNDFTLNILIEQITNDFLFKVVIFGLSGIALGFINWHNITKQYKQILENNENG